MFLLFFLMVAAGMLGLLWLYFPVQGPAPVESTPLRPSISTPATPAEKPAETPAVPTAADAGTAGDTSASASASATAVSGLNVVSAISPRFSGFTSSRYKPICKA